MNNRQIITTFALASSCFVDANAEELKRPNILWLTYEDTSPQFIGCYGNDMAITPTIDSLAADGVRFTNAFSTGTVSSASRFCLITGCKPGKYGTGNHRSEFVIPDFVHGFPEYLKDAGYYTTNDVKTDYNHYNHKKMSADSWSDCSRGASWRAREPGQPFFAVYNSNHSHQSRTMTNPWELYERDVLTPLAPERTLSIDAPFEMPEFYRDSPQMRKYVSRIYNSIALTDQDFAQVLKNLEDDGLRDSTIIFCFSDHGEGMPRAKGSALAAGYRVPFVLWIPPMYKHLTPWGSGVITDELVSFEDFGATVLSLSGVEIPSYNEGVPFLPKQKLENRSDKKRYVFGACDAVDNNIELSRSVTDGNYIYTRVFTNYQPFVRWIAYYDHSDLQKQMRYDMGNGLLNRVEQEIMQTRDIEYLYDIKNDKWELVNLAKSPLYQNVVVEMREVLKSHLLESRDANFMPEYTLASYLNIKTPYDMRLDNSLYPFEEVLETAYLSGMGKDVITEQIERLTHNNEFVSYWASIGLFTQREDLKPYFDTVEKLLSKIKQPIARIWCAAALLNIEESTQARDILNNALTSSNDLVAVAAFNALFEIDKDTAMSFIPQFREMERVTNEMSRPKADEMYLLTRQRLEGVEFKYERYW